MSSFFDLCALFVAGCIGLFALMLVLMHLPNSPLKTLALRGMAGGFALLSPVYLISPVDVIPDVFFPIGFVDDLVVLVGGFCAARYAISGEVVKDDHQ